MFDCNNESDQIAAANQHAVDSTTFNTYLSNFWGTTAPSPEVKTWTDLSTMMADKDCETECWKLSFNPNDTTNNSITFGFQTLTNGNPPSYSAGLVYYSIAMIKGVKALDSSVVAFHFFKAKNASNQYDVIFKAVDNIGQPVYFGDLSDLYP